VQWARGRRSSVFEELEAAPYRHDFYQTLRRLECLFEDKPRWGRALRPVDEPVRLGQEPDLSFAPAPLASFEAHAGKTPRLRSGCSASSVPTDRCRFTSPSTARERLQHAGDPTLSRFLDIFSSSFPGALLPRLGAAQPAVNRDRPRDDRFTTYVGAVSSGLSPATFRNRDTLPDLAKFFTWRAHPPGAEPWKGSSTSSSTSFRVPVRDRGVCRPLDVARRRRAERPVLRGAALGTGAVLGGRVWDRQHKFRIHLGPLTLRQYASFLPGGEPLRKLVDWVRMYLCFELDWDVRLLLEQGEVPPLKLGAGPRLGWTTWLGQRQSSSPADDLCLDAEAFVANGVRAA